MSEFTETPYAASFGPVPTNFHEESPAESTDATPAPPPVPAPVAIPPPHVPEPTVAATTTETGGDRRYGGGTRRSHVPSVDKVVMDDSVKNGLAAVEQLSLISPEDSGKWDQTVQIAVAELRSIQLKWMELEAERKSLVKPSQPQSYATRGVKRRGRGRGRRRGRWRGV